MSRLAMYAPDEYTVTSDYPSIELIRERQRDAEAENPTCDECGEVLADLDKQGTDTTCWYCIHPECEDGTPCVDCYSESIDRAMDSMDMER
jgi:hypothetical protein